MTFGCSWILSRLLVGEPENGSLVKTAKEANSYRYFQMTSWGSSGGLIGNVYAFGSGLRRKRVEGVTRP